MPEVISDTSPLQYLHQAEVLDLLPTLYDRIIVPTGVAAEIEAGRALGVSLPELSNLKWVRIVSAPSPKVLPLAVDLGQGEREVLSLAVEGADTLAILDDGLARHFARYLEIAFTGTLGVLLRAKHKGHLNVIRPTVDRLENLGFRLDAATRDSVLDLAGEG